MAAAAVATQAHDIYQLLTTEFYCVTVENKCCRQNGGPSWHKIIDRKDEGAMDMSSAIWDEFILSPGATFQVDIKLMFDKATNFEDSDGFAFVLQRDGYDAIGKDYMGGFLGIETALPAVTFEPLTTRSTGGFKVSIPMAEGSPSSEIMTINESYDVALFYDAVKNEFQVGVNDKILIQGTIDVFKATGGIPDQGLFWGFTSGGANCIEDIVSLRHLQIEQHQVMKKAEPEAEEEAQVAELVTEANVANPFLVEEHFEDGEHSGWVFVRNLFGHYGALDDQMRGKLGITVGRDGTKGIRLRLLDELTPDAALLEQDVACGYQHEFQLDHDVENLELFVDFRAHMDATFTPEDIGEVRAALVGKASMEIFQCNGGDCNTDWTPRVINLGPCSAGDHTIQIGAVLKKKSPRGEGKKQRTFTTRINSVIVKEVEPMDE